MSEGRPVPPHGSGPVMPKPSILRYDRKDPDETRGRVLARQLAERDARHSIAMGRKVRLTDDAPADIVHQLRHFDVEARDRVLHEMCREAADEIERLRTSLKEKTTVPCGECKGTGNRLCRPMWAGDPHPPQDLCPKCLGKGRTLATMGDQTRD